MGEFLAPGERVGPYTIESALGIGSMGVSYRAHNADGDVVALKFLRSGVPLTDREKVKIGRDFATLASLNNASLPEIIEFVLFRDDYAIVTEYQVLGDLAGRLARGPLALPTALALMRHLARAVGEAHAAGVVHGGITPANVLRRAVDGRQVPLLVDFGSALRGHAWLPSSGAPDVARYRASEVRDGRGMSAAADVFALGTLLSAMVGPTAPPEVRDLVLRATHSRPGRRFRNGRMFHDALVQVAQVPVSGPEPAPAPLHSTGPTSPPLPRPAVEVPSSAREAAARLLTSEASGLSDRRYRPRSKLIGGIVGAALVALLINIMFAGPKGSIFGGASNQPPAPTVVATPAYRAVLFRLQQPSGDASVIQVLNGTVWNQVGSSTYNQPTAKGGQQACAVFRVADASQSPPATGPQVTSCGTSSPSTLVTQRIQPDCRYSGARQVCYSVLASGLAPDTSDTMVLRVEGRELRTVSITVDKSGHASLPDGDYFHFTSSLAGKTADVTYMGLEHAWTIDKRH